MIEPKNVEHHTRDVLVRDAGRGFLERNHFQVTQEDANDGIFECVGEIKLAGNFNFQRDNHFYDEDLIHSIHRLIKKTHWHFVELMILAIKALINRQLQHASTGFFENSNKTFFGFLIQSNPYAKSYLTWKTYRESDSIGITGKGILETLKIIGNSGVTVPGLMFDLCYLLLNLETKKVINRNLRNLDHYKLRVPGEVLPHKVYDLDTDNPFLLDGDHRHELNRIFGMSLSLLCIPDRIRQFNNQERNVIEFMITHFEIGTRGYSTLGKNQLFSIENDDLIAAPTPKTCRCLSINDYIAEKKLVADIRGEVIKDDAFNHTESNFTGYATLQYSPKSKDDSYTLHSETYLTICLPDEIFDNISIAIKQGQVNHVSVNLNIWIDSIFTSTSKYDGHATDIIFNSVNNGDGKIENFAIEYLI